MKKLLVMAAGMAVLYPCRAQKTIFHSVVFEHDSISVSEPMQRKLDTLYDNTARGTLINVGLEGGFSWNTRERRSMSRLSKMRCRSIKDYLVMRGLRPENIKIVPCITPTNRLVVDAKLSKKMSMTLYQLEWLKPENERIQLVPPPKNDSSQYFLVYQHNGITFTGKYGTKISFTDNTFEYPNGQEVQCEVITIRLKEFYTWQQIADSNLVTSSGGKMLATGGMFWMAAYCNGWELKVRAGKEVEVHMPLSGNPEYDMQVFLSDGNSAPDDWSNSGTGVQPQVTQPDSAVYFREGDYVERMYPQPKADAYFFKLNTFGWVNCDRFYNATQTTETFVKADTALKPRVNMIFKNIRSMVGGQYIAKDTVKFSGIPASEPVTLVAYAQKDKKIYYGRLDFTTGRKEVPEITMEEMSEAEYKNALAELNKK